LLCRLLSIEFHQNYQASVGFMMMVLHQERRFVLDQFQKHMALGTILSSIKVEYHLELLDFREVTILQ
jgi:hypothetical protein